MAAGISCDTVTAQHPEIIPYGINMTDTGFLRTATPKQAPLSCFALSLLGRMYTLQLIDLSGIHTACGPPADFAYFPALLFLDLHGCSLNGSIPQSVQLIPAFLSRTPYSLESLA